MNLRAALNQSIFLRTLCRRILLCFFIPVFCSTAFSQDQNKALSNTKANSSKDISARLEAITKNSIARAKAGITTQENKIRNDVGKFVQAQKKENRQLKGTNSARSGAIENPLDKEKEGEKTGVLDERASKEEYKNDSKIILNDLTFPRCMEPRLVVEGVGFVPNIATSDFVNIGYMLRCMANCINPLKPDDWNERWQVLSYYWPEYQLSVNKAGAQMIDPDIMAENRGNGSGKNDTGLYRNRTSESEDTGDEERDRKKQKKLLSAMDLPSELIKDPDWHKSGKETHLQQDGEVRFVSAMRPNAMWRAADARPRNLEGWTKSPKCLFDALDLPTSQKKVIANRMDQGIFAISSKYPETRKLVDRVRYTKTSARETKLSAYKRSTPKDYAEYSCASYRLAANPAVYGDLDKLGVKPNNDPTLKEYCLPGGYTLSGSMYADLSTPFLQADAVRATMASLWLSDDSLGRFAGMNSYARRLPNFTRYEKRIASVVPRYVNFEINPGENNSMIVYLDKLQRIYPTQPMTEGPSDAVGGASSEGGYRTTAGQRGSHCFRPEDIPNWSSEGVTNVTEWPLGLQQDVRKNFGETRWAMWNRRVLCTCERDGNEAGCLNLNAGDFHEDGFAGRQDYTGRVLPDPFTKAMPIIKTFAEQEGPPGASAIAIEGASTRAIDTSVLGSGPTNPQMPGGKAFPIPNMPQLGQLICSLIPGYKPQQQDQQNQNQQQNQEPQNQQQTPPADDPPRILAPPPNTPAIFDGPEVNGVQNIFGPPKERSISPNQVVPSDSNLNPVKTGFNKNISNSQTVKQIPKRITKKIDANTYLISTDNSPDELCTVTSEQNGSLALNCKYERAKGATGGNGSTYNIFSTPASVANNNAILDSMNALGPNLDGKPQAAGQATNGQNQCPGPGCNSQNPNGQQNYYCNPAGGNGANSTCGPGGCGGGGGAGGGGGCGAGGCGGGGGGGAGGGGGGGGLGGLGGIFGGLGGGGLPGGIGGLGGGGLPGGIGGLGGGGLPGGIGGLGGGGLPGGLGGGANGIPGINGLPSGLGNGANGLGGLGGTGNIPNIGNGTNLPTGLNNIPNIPTGNNNKPKPEATPKDPEPEAAKPNDQLPVEENKDTNLSSAPNPSEVSAPVNNGEVIDRF